MSVFFVLGMPWNYIILRLFHERERGSMFAMLLFIPLIWYTLIGIIVNIAILVLFITLSN